MVTQEVLTLGWVECCGRQQRPSKPALPPPDLIESGRPLEDPLNYSKLAIAAALLLLAPACEDSDDDSASSSSSTTMMPIDVDPDPDPVDTTGTTGTTGEDLDTSTGDSGDTGTTGDDSTSGGEVSTSSSSEADTSDSTSSGGEDSSSTSTSTGDESSTTGDSTTGAVPVCGDGFVDAGEDCDDGANNANNAACTLGCNLAVCGDGYTHTGLEECDDANDVNTDDCLNSCKLAFCGDGVTHAGVEQCDDANQNNADSCSSLCVAATCNDGAQNGAETATDCGGPTCKACSIPGLIINEIDYDTPADVNDVKEFIELLNTTQAPIDLAGVKVMLVNGDTQTVYKTIDLSGLGSVEGGRYLVIATPAVTVEPAALKIAAVGGTIQNGTPDGIVLVDTLKGVVLDALSYEGTMKTVTLPGFAQTVSLVEGEATGVSDSNLVSRSLGRLPNGYDGNNAATDWAEFDAPTPGSPNM